VVIGEKNDDDIMMKAALSVADGVCLISVQCKMRKMRAYPDANQEVSKAVERFSVPLI
jgi:hypothetical protein